VLFAKIFLPEIISSINEIVSFEKEIIFECFTQILTLSYIDEENPNLFKLNT